jgi:phosphoribosyl-ATP pyrophosphohydrolase/phosphoribosyl-AMP cyclohydrolase
MYHQNSMLNFDSRGLIPAIVQDAITGRVLMLGWMNAESLQRTKDSGEVWFFSRSRDELWHKGATSGNVLKVRDLRADCDQDAILVRAEPAGPTCHTGRESCFFHDVDGNELPHQSEVPAAGFLDELENIVANRRASTPDESYTARLFAKGKHKIAQKVGEEGLETAMAGVAQNDERLIDESADLLFHLLVLLNERNIPLRTVLAQLSTRHNEQ